MADMIPCRRCGHYDIVCEQEMEQLRAEIAKMESLLTWYAGIHVGANDANDCFHEDIGIPAQEYLAGLS